ncbi:hypothetical protein [Allosphingosinicella sp.]|jgi:glutathione S-transferase|uniref:hypothetical protein n=1 Tax=Allosphingosinicella sp. TaxID=2823234 RepID=UPI002F0351C1
MTSPAHRDKVTLLTFAPTLDSEQARLLLSYYGISYRERNHLPPFFAIASKLHGGTGDVPLVYGRGANVTGPRPIAEHYDAKCPPELRLIPTEPPLAAQFEADWQLYNGSLGSGTAIYAYYHLLPQRKLMAPIFAAPVSFLERLIMPIFYSVMRGLLNSALKLSPEAAEAGQAKVLDVFAQTDKRVADGRLYLNGDRMTLGDVALAGCAAPLLLPTGFGAKLPALEQMPEPMRSLMKELRARPTAQFVQRFYSEGLPAARAKRAAAMGG